MHKVIDKIDSRVLAETIVEGMQDVKAKDITILDLRDIHNSVTDFFVICSGDSTTQVEGASNAIVRHTRKELRDKPWHEEGKRNGEWILLDYVNVVVHIFHKDVRSFYEIEDLWADAKRTDIPNLD